METLYCMNPDCVAKKIKSFSLFTSRDAMNIDGLSEATLEKFIAMGFIHNLGDIFEIGKYKDQIVEMEGFGQKSFDNLMASLEKAKETTLAKVIYSLGIAGIGLANARVICRYFDDDIEKNPAMRMQKRSTPLRGLARCWQAAWQIIFPVKRIIRSLTICLAIFT